MSTTNVRFSKELLNNLKKNNIKPIIVAEIDGIPFKIGSSTIKKVARYGDEGLFYGDEGLVYGGLVPIANQQTLISLDGTTTSIKQELQPDKARGSSISSMRLDLTDINGIATKIATGFYGEVLYKDVKVWVGFSEQSSFNEDYILIFRGLVESVNIRQAVVSFNLSSPDQKRRQSLAIKGDTSLDNNIDASQTTISVDSVDNFIVIPSTPGGGFLQDTTLKTYIKIEDELIEYTGITSNQFTGCIRGSLSTSASIHNLETQVEAFYVLEGNIMDVALKIMLSDKDTTPYITDLEATSVNDFLGDNISNAIYFSGVNMIRDYNVSVGDFVITNSFTEASNNIVTYTEILGIEVLDSGSYIVIDSTLSDEPSTNGLVTFLSQYNTLGDFGLNMNTEEVDIEKHLFLKNNFLNDSEIRIYVRDEIDEAKEFIELQLYKPFACYSLPSDKRGLSRLSVGYHIAPLPIEQIVTVNSENIINPDQLRSDRSINKYHYNVVGFLYNDSPADETLRKKIFEVVGTQLIPTGNKTLKIESLGLRDDLGASNQAVRAATRLLNRYKGAAEFYPSVDVLFSSGVIINIGDIVVLDPTNLNLPNRSSYNRSKEPLLMEVLNKSTDVKTGNTTLSLIDTAFDINARYGLVSPTSKITKVIDQTQFQIEHPIGSDYSGYGIFEGKKWDQYIGASLEIYNSDFTLSDTAILKSVTNNILKIDAALSFSITANNFYIKLDSYSNQTDKVQLVFAFLSDDTNNFADGKIPYTVL